MTEIQLVDKCDVKLVRHASGDDMVAAAAWVSTSGLEAVARLEKEGNDPTKLINFLMEHRHGTPFEHNMMTFFVDAPIFVFREFHRHRIGWSYNETSGRYSQLQPRFWIPPDHRALVPEPGYKATKPQFVPGTPEDLRIVRETQSGIYRNAYAEYEMLLKAGIAKEVARTVLPVGIMTQCWCTCNARSMMHFLSLRTHDKTAQFVSYPQAEIEEVARKMENTFAELFPIVYKSFNQHGRVAP